MRSSQCRLWHVQTGREIMRKVLVKSLVLACVVVIACLAASAAGATPIAVGSWQPYFFGATGSTATGSPFTFTSSGAALVTVTDAFCRGDRFTVSDGAMSLGTTTLVAVDLACDTIVSNPGAALADPGYRSSRFIVGAGAHSIGIVPPNTPFQDGCRALLH